MLAWPRYEVMNDLDYAPGLQLDLYRPNLLSKQTVLVFAHGGGWFSGDRQVMDAFCRKVAAAGYPTASIDYGMMPQFYFPAPLEHMRQAIAWVRTHGKQYHYQPQKIILVGFSAGAGMSLLIGLDNKDDISGIVSVAGFADLTHLEDSSSDGVKQTILEWMNGQDLRAASAIFKVDAKDPPVLLIHGSDDTTAPTRQSYRLLEALKKHGVEHKLVIYPGLGHELVTPQSIEFDSVVQHITEFAQAVDQGQSLQSMPD